MNELLSESNHYYILFAMFLILTNSIAKYIFDDETKSTRVIVLIFSITLLFAFLILTDAKLFRLIIAMFATFGFYDFVGRYIERLYMFIAMKVFDYAEHIWTNIKKLIKL